MMFLEEGGGLFSALCHFFTPANTFVQNDFEIMHDHSKTLSLTKLFIINVVKLWRREIDKLMDNVFLYLTFKYE